MAGCVFGIASYINPNMQAFQITDMRNCQRKLKRNRLDANSLTGWACSACTFCRLSVKQSWQDYIGYPGRWGHGGSTRTCMQTRHIFCFFVNFIQKKGTYPKVLPCMNQNVPRWYTKTYSLCEQWCFPGGLHRQCTVQITSCQPQIDSYRIFS